VSGSRLSDPKVTVAVVSIGASRRARTPSNVNQGSLLARHRQPGPLSVPALLRHLVGAAIYRAHIELGRRVEPEQVRPADVDAVQTGEAEGPDLRRVLDVPISQAALASASSSASSVRWWVRMSIVVLRCRARKNAFCAACLETPTTRAIAPNE